MKVLKMIAEWRRGCACSAPGHPEDCPMCTKALIEAIEREAQGETSDWKAAARQVYIPGHERRWPRWLRNLWLWF